MLLNPILLTYFAIDECIFYSDKYIEILGNEEIFSFNKSIVDVVIDSISEKYIISDSIINLIINNVFEHERLLPFCVNCKKNLKKILHHYHLPNHKDI